jgi:hypothetical protein
MTGATRAPDPAAQYLASRLIDPPSTAEDCLDRVKKYLESLTPVPDSLRVTLSLAVIYRYEEPHR